MPFTLYRTQRLRFIFLVYWIFLAYIVAALVYWFIALNQQKELMAEYEIAQLVPGDTDYQGKLAAIADVKKRKTAQYLGEGSIFLLLIIAGAVFVYRVVRRQFKSGQEQQHFMMAVTHELKTPIAITKLNLETLQKRKLEESQQQRLIQNTIQEANRLNALCNNMLLASQMEAGGHVFAAEEINLSGVVEDCVDDFITRYPQRPFIKEVATGIFLQGDLLMLQMAVNNLIDNAIKYAPKESPITILLKQQHQVATLMVKDEGKGIPPQEKKKVFNKFYRIGNKATREARGTGLGLFLTKKIVAQHHAAIFVTDNQPCGSIFTIEFQLQDEANE